MPEPTPSLPAKVVEKVVEAPLISHSSDAVQNIATGIAARLPYFALALALFALFFFGARWVRRLVFRVISRDGRFINTALLMARSAYAGILALGALVALAVAVPGFTPGQLLGALGFLSVALGFAFRDVISNWLAGVFILLSEPYRIGDAISIAGFEGRVEEIQTRSTLLQAWDGRRVVMPNAKLFTDALVIENALPTRRVELQIGLAPETDVRHARRAMQEALQRVSGVLSEPAPRVLLSDVNDNKFVFQLFFWFEPSPGHDLPGVRDQAWEAVLEALDAAGLERARPLPFLN